MSIRKMSVSTIDDMQIQQIVQRVLNQVMGLPRQGSVPGEIPSGTETAPISGAQTGARKVVAIGADHGGFDLKETLKADLSGMGLDINDVILRGLNQGMHIVGDLYEKREYFLPDIIVSADALYETLAIFKPHLKLDQSYKATVVIGVVRGDIHDIGKNDENILRNHGIQGH